MDQLKQVLAVMKKYHFWILAALILVAYLATWFLATGKMTSETNDRVSKISSDFDAGSRIQGVQNHPNDLSIKMMNELNDAEALQVEKA